MKDFWNSRLSDLFVYNFQDVRLLKSTLSNLNFIIIQVIGFYSGYVPVRHFLENANVPGVIRSRPTVKHSALNRYEDGPTRALFSV